MIRGIVTVAGLAALAGCGLAPDAEEPLIGIDGSTTYETVRLQADLSALSDAERTMLSHFIDAARWMDEAFWHQALPDMSRKQLLGSVDDEALRKFAEVNYGPWDRLDGDRPFLQGFGAKPAGAAFYPVDMTVEEFEAACAAAPDGGEALRDPYTMVWRDPDGELRAAPYNEYFDKQTDLAAQRLRQAADLAEDDALATYLRLRADALQSNDYRASDMAWMDMKDNRLDVVIGPIENYEDRLFNYKTAFEAYVLVKDLAWSERLGKYAALLPELQRGLPVPPEYKEEEPGTDSDLNAYDVVYYAGDCNAGAKTIAINLPNDEQVQLEKGSRRLQLKNAMRAKFDRILVPIADVLIAEEQRSHVSFDAFFANTMFHEVAHGLGIKSTISGGGTVREALREHSATMEEGKADVLGLYMVTRLAERGELDTAIESHYVTFLAGIFRSVRFGASSDHGRANMIRFNFFREAGAFTRDAQSGRYRVDFVRMRAATDALSERILRLQGDGDYDGVRRLIDELGAVDDELASDLARVNEAGIATDIVFEQGKQVLGL